MKKLLIASAIGIALTTTGSAFAATSSGSLTVTASVEASLSLSIESANGSFSGSGTNAATSVVGGFSKYGAVPSGFTISRGPTQSQLDAVNGIGVKVIKANSASASFILTAQLASPSPNGVVWLVGNAGLSDTAPAVVADSGTYDTTVVYPWGIRFNDSVVATSVNNVINFSAVSN